MPGMVGNAPWVQVEELVWYSFQDARPLAGTNTAPEDVSVLVYHTLLGIGAAMFGRRFSKRPAFYKLLPTPSEMDQRDVSYWAYAPEGPRGVWRPILRRDVRRVKAIGELGALLRKVKPGKPA